MVTHSNKTRFGELKAMLRDNLSLEPDQRLVITTQGSNPSLCEDHETMQLNAYVYTSPKTYYAYCVGDGPLVTVFNNHSQCYGKSLTQPFVTTLDGPLTRRLVEESVSCSFLRG